MIWSILTPDVLVVLAGGCFVLGYLIINQLLLRWMLFLGSVIYVAYYATAAETPLWGAIYLSFAMMAANLIGICSLLIQRSQLAIPRAHRDLYPEFSNLPPGDFRQLVLAAKRHRVNEDTVLSREGEPIRKLYYVISGTAQVEKQGATFALPPRVLIGEVAYMCKRASAATTVLPAGSEILEWDTLDLDRRSATSDRFQLALQAMISRDMVEKVALAVAPVSYERATPTEPVLQHSVQ